MRLTPAAERLLYRNAGSAQKSDSRIFDTASDFALPGRRPLIPLKAVVWSTYREEDDILGLIGDRILTAFNVAAPSARKSVPVIWTRSLCDYLANRPPTRPSEADLWADIFPGSQPTFRTAELSRLLCCTRCHISNLVMEGALQATKPGPLQPGTNVTRHILRGSLIEFLQTRRIS